MSTATTLESFLFPAERMPASYYGLAIEQLLSSSTALGADARKALQGYTVSKVTCCKELAHPQHEYVLVEVRDFDDRIAGLLRFERSAQHTPGESSTAHGSAATISRLALEASARVVTGATSSSKHKVLAADSVCSVKSHIEADKRAKVTSFAPGLRPTIMDLYILLSLINGHSEYYSLLKHQCYWFADVFSLVLETLCKPDIIVEGVEWATPLETPAPPDSVTSLDSPKQGSYFGYTTPQGRDKKEVVVKLVGKLKEEREKSAALARETEEGLKEAAGAVQRADEQERLKNEATERADEQERLKNEATKRADEQERLKNEVTKRADEQERLKNEVTKRADEEKKRTDEEIAELRRLLGEQQRQAKEDKEDKKRAGEEPASMRRLLAEQRA